MHEPTYPKKFIIFVYSGHHTAADLGGNVPQKQETEMSRLTSNLE